TRVYRTAPPKLTRQPLRAGPSYTVRAQGRARGWRTPPPTPCIRLACLAGSTGIEPATSGLTVQCANQAAPRARIGTSTGYMTLLSDATALCALNCARQLPRHVLQVRRAHDVVS